MPPFSTPSSGSEKEKETATKVEKSSILEESSNTQDAKNSSSPNSEFPLKKSIIRAQGKPFLYIRDGDFDIVWTNVAIFTVACLLHAYSFYVIFSSWTTPVLLTWICCYWVGMCGGMGITAGAHRLWSHRSYKGCLALRIFLMIGQCIAGQNSLYVWCRDHRVHHKFSETDSDPHNTKRGFFFAHVGWLLRKKHPQLILDSEKLDFSDLMADPVVRIQHQYYFPLYVIFAFVAPSLVPWYFWGESLFNSFLIVYLLRYMTSLHSTWFVNSTAHMIGFRPFNHKIQPRENAFVSYGAAGEGYHNYHHSFPFDYRTSESGVTFNLTKTFIDLMAELGLAYDLKVTPDYLIRARKRKVLELTKKSNIKRKN